MTTNARAELPNLDSQQFRELYARLKNTVHWGTADRRGALNHITTPRLLAALTEVRLGLPISMAAAVTTDVAVDNPHPAVHDMISSPGEHRGAPGLHFAYDRMAMNIHGDADSHIDALCHVIYDGEMYNDVPAGATEPDGSPSLSIDVARNGIVGRGVLLDIPRLHGVSWLEPGEHVTVQDLGAAEQAQGLRVGPGDLLFVHVGHRRRRASVGAWDAASARSGLHPTALEFLAERQVAVLGSDGNNDTAPATGVGYPVHVLAVNALGIHLLDYLRFDDLLPVCERENRWTFLCVIAPLRLPEATGSPVNPIAVL
ncbi:MAG: cyclase family protein [Hamadaea sp.]|uniref:cyclase family protein n=1 Tax=Hamadaea sp. TaxID=2024425 RepID=UPI00184D4637|nr:cyclase family protein [Hamadaea sp.]NUR72632.1 cyclase family protein [Hamadaea sp.]NUT23073.1 cyclase family protein [Hamadaea sp.]